MRRIGIGFAVAVTIGTQAVAGERENALTHIAQVTAITQLCPRLTMNKGMVLLMAQRFGVDFDRDQSELMTQARSQMEPWRGKETAACAAGIYLYGPKGVNVPGLLDMK